VNEGAPLLVGCHGYGETAADHLEELGRIPGSERYALCAVEALHPFYKKDGTVVRSWMTREDRQRAIDANVRYLASVIAQVRRDAGATGPLVVAGFSQGVAMAWRTVARSGWPAHGLISLAGDVPPEVRSAGALGLAGAPSPAVLLGRGTGDPWYTEQKMGADLEALAEMGLSAEACVFEGGHEWSDAFRQAAAHMLERALDR
ncbi:MAG: hypothetical protein MI919_18720, partial [Holophagales bacterium]|nr:hypothetical protein [Holophagales bacterium]